MKGAITASTVLPEAPEHTWRGWDMLMKKPTPSPTATPTPTPDPTVGYQRTGWQCSYNEGGPAGPGRCECGNSKNDGFHYLYNEGRVPGEQTGVCGIDGCWCCRRPSPPPPPT